MLQDRNYNLPNSIQVVHSKRAQRLSLRLDSYNRIVRMTVPEGVSMHKAEQFAQTHAIWIEEQLKSLPDLAPFVDGADIPIFGQLRHVKITKNKDTKRTQITLDKKLLKVQTGCHNPNAHIVRYLKKIAKETLTILSTEKASKINQHVNAVRVRDTKSQWGSCSADGTISYSWRLIFAPYEAMDYVVAHEVAHLQYLNHSKAFWKVCMELSDDYFEGKYWMKAHGKELMAYGNEGR